MLDGFESSYTYFWDFVALWGLFLLFTISVLIATTLADIVVAARDPRIRT